MYETVTLPFVLNVLEEWWPFLPEEHGGLRMKCGEEFSILKEEEIPGT